MTAIQEKPDCFGRIPRPEEIRQEMQTLCERLRLARQLLKISKHFYPDRIIGTITISSGVSR